MPPPFSPHPPHPPLAPAQKRCPCCPGRCAPPPHVRDVEPARRDAAEQLERYRVRHPHRAAAPDAHLCPRFVKFNKQPTIVHVRDGPAHVQHAPRPAHLVDQAAGGGSGGCGGAAAAAGGVLRAGALTADAARVVKGQLLRHIQGAHPRHRPLDGRRAARAARVQEGPAASNGREKCGARGGGELLECLYQGGHPLLGGGRERPPAAAVGWGDELQQLRPSILRP